MKLYDSPLAFYIQFFILNCGVMKPLWQDVCMLIFFVGRPYVQLCSSCFKHVRWQEQFSFLSCCWWNLDIHAVTLAEFQKWIQPSHFLLQQTCKCFGENVKMLPKIFALLCVCYTPKLFHLAVTVPWDKSCESTLLFISILLPNMCKCL